MTELLQTLAAFLRQTQLKARCICWQLLRLSGSTETVEVYSDSAGQNWELWLELSNLKFDNTEIGRDIEGLALQVDNLCPIEPSRADLFADALNEEPLQALVDRLRSRLGLAAIRQITGRAEHLPEHCIHTGAEVPPTDTHPTGAQRPFWLLPQPQPVQQKAGILSCNGVLTLRHGPERIEDEWWRTPVSRDYYIAQREDEEWVWIFRDRHSGRWYLQGLFS